MRQRPFSTDAFFGLPTTDPATRYIAVGNLTFAANSDDPEDIASVLIIVADSDDALVTTTATSTNATCVAGVQHHPQAMDVYQLLSDFCEEDLTSSNINSTKPIAVSSGGSCLQVPVGTVACDHISEMHPPRDTWISTFLAAPLASGLGDIFRILSGEDDTDGTIGDVIVAQLAEAAFFQTEINASALPEIETREPCLIAHYNKRTRADVLRPALRRC